MTPEIVVTSAPNARMREGVAALARRATYADGVAPLSEQVLLDLRECSPGIVHLLVLTADHIAGYAQWDTRTRNAELVVDPARRRRGIATAMLVRLRAVAGERGAGLAPSADGNSDGPRMWAHGDLAPAQALAGRLGLVKIRELWRLVRPLGDITSAPATPAGLVLGTFDEERDVAAWLAVNKAAFASHPEQGQWSEHDLRLRMAEDWFDPTAFFLLRDGFGIAGFVWLKIEGDDGEIYVLGVDPARQSAGIGRYLIALAVNALNRRGLKTASLYVEADNARAVTIYRDAGFEAVTADGQYAFPA